MHLNCCGPTGISKPVSTKKKIAFGISVGHDNYVWEEQDVERFYETWRSGGNLTKSRIVQFTQGGPYYCALYRGFPVGRDQYIVSKLTPESVRCDKSKKKTCIAIKKGNDNHHCKAVGEWDYMNNIQYKEITFPYSYIQLDRGVCPKS